MKAKNYPKSDRKLRAEHEDSPVHVKKTRVRKKQTTKKEKTFLAEGKQATLEKRKRKSEDDIEQMFKTGLLST